jgi:multiple sugar transport system substrate-binding protein
MRLRMLGGAVLCAALAVAAVGCGSGGGSSSSKTIKIAYQRWGPGRVMDHELADWSKEFQKQNPGTKVQLVPIVASENDYYTKLQLMMRSPRTAPDIVREDTFLINSDIQAGYLRPLDPYLAKWKDWSQFEPVAKTAGKAQDGKTYGVTDGTDTRAVWYDKTLFKKAGLPVPWQPKNWNDILSAARTIKAKDPGVYPWNIYSGKAAGEASAMQGFEMLLYGTGDSLYNKQQGKWVIGSQGFKDSLSLLKTVYGTKLGPPVQQALTGQIQNVVAQEWMPKHKVAINLDGSWLPNTWLKTGAKPWSAWSKDLGQTPMPTENGQAPGKVSLSGGWTWAIPQRSKNPDLAWKMVELMETKANNLRFVNENAQIAVRKDVGADPKYTGAQPTVKFFTDLVPVTQYRPALPVYPKISNQITVAMEAVMTGQQTPDAAAKAYDQAVTGIVGKDKTTTQSG